MRGTFMVLIVTSLFALWIGCSSDSGVTDPDDGGNNGGGDADTLVPEVTITSPADGTTLPSSLNITGTATDDTEVDTVFFEVRDLCETTLWSELDLTEPYGATWDASGVQDGGYRICMAAVDSAGNMSDWVCVTVSKGTSSAQITGFSPSAAYVGRSIGAVGSGFGPDNGNGRVKVFGREATVEEWTDTLVTFTIPSGVPEDAGMFFEIHVDCRWWVTGTIEVLPDRIIRITDSNDQKGHPCWNSNGTKIYFEMAQNTNWDIWRMNADGSSWRQVTFYPEADFTPDIKPSTGEMAWMSMRGVEGSYDIYHGFLITEPPGNVVWEAPITSDNDKCRAPAYAHQVHQGYSMVYNRVYDPNDTGSGVPTIFLYGSTAGHVELTEGDNPAFTYDGRWVVYQREGYQINEICKIEVGGSTEPTVLTTGFGDYNPHVGWQNDKIVFTRNGMNGYRGLCVVNLDGTGFEVLLDQRWAQYEAAWSPDCTKIVFTGHRMGQFDIYIYEVP
jgi:hypothetical protein